MLGPVHHPPFMQSSSDFCICGHLFLLTWSWNCAALTSQPSRQAYGKHGRSQRCRKHHLFVKKIFLRSRESWSRRRWSVAECCGFERTEVRSLLDKLIYPKVVGEQDNGNHGFLMWKDDGNHGFLMWKQPFFVLMWKVDIHLKHFLSSNCAAETRPHVDASFPSKGGE